MKLRVREPLAHRPGLAAARSARDGATCIRMSAPPMCDERSMMWQRYEWRLSISRTWPHRVAASGAYGCSLWCIRLQWRLSISRTLVSNAPRALPARAPSFEG